MYDNEKALVTVVQVMGAQVLPCTRMLKVTQNLNEDTKQHVLRGMWEGRCVRDIALGQHSNKFFLLAAYPSTPSNACHLCGLSVRRHEPGLIHLPSSSKRGAGAPR